MKSVAFILDLIPAATAASVFLAAWQLRIRSQLAQTSFEDTLSREYRDLMAQIPFDALVGNELNTPQKASAKEAVFNYLDLTNEQIFLRSKRRIRKATWRDWAEGVEINMARPIFREVWESVGQSRPDMFSELRKLEASNYKDDPGKWRSQANRWVGR